ncbi:RNA polymerase factor sigma-54 [Clostridium autoethanogenum]|uniref:RNA polymerase sigma-54 factor n=3 Tax=Clostridium TaxID=1485 RepID=D8GUR5_CLOLD|nr:predicted RNA polymerase sigma-54 factor [Clostridium ljungdahlii DSM 13528]ALU36145.1 RNA polymerase sigma-54 subunit [Clostridium autoethanogenum DSM 10061]OAA85319.1 RNA polymerase sigma-54 factor [Clostridium ljungdahlii DSM 13528]OVY51797.1 RNA polymerase sigma-54 factor [Clostridium autoethanogenum]RMD04420.1 RNA polymerase factor sigma-54 [Clostridium autoethanogenum]
MNMDFGLNLTQEQKLIMTQQMQLSIKMLQMSSFELQEYIEKEFQQNPVLDVKEPDSTEIEKDKLDYKEIIKSLNSNNFSHQSYQKSDEEEVSPFNFISHKKSLKEYLKEEIMGLNEKDYVKSICSYIIENIDHRGYLVIEEGEIEKDLKISTKLVKYCIGIIQTLEPYGIGARNLSECLRIQARQRKVKDENIFIIIDKYLELIAENKYNVIAKNMGINVKQAQEYGDIIKTFDPKPSRGFYTGEDVKYIIPDAYIEKIGDKYYIIMNDDLTPRLIINSVYKDIVENQEDKEAADYVKEKLNSAVFLIKSIQHRKSTIYKVLQKILDLQRDYFDYGERYLKPMTLKDIASSMDMHESTISRAIRDKYIYTSRGTIKIKDLFTTGISKGFDGEDVSVLIIKKSIEKIINEEDKKKPLSDQQICDLVNQQDMNISRRTVAKYREEMGIKSSKGRRRF